MASRADHADLRDGKDVRGPLDLQRITVGGQRPPRWSIYTWGRWTVARVWDRGFMVVRFDTFGDARFDYHAIVGSDGDRLRGALYRNRKRRPDRRIRWLKVWRSSRRAVHLLVPFGAMRFSDEYSYRWTAHSIWTGTRCGNTCLDRAPEGGAVTEPRPLPTPTVTITPTPTPTETGA